MLIVTEPPLVTVALCGGHSADVCCALAVSGTIAPNTTSTAIAIHRAIATRKTASFIIFRPHGGHQMTKTARGEP